MRVSVLVVTVAVLWAAFASADYYDPPEGWSDNPYFTHQQWEFSTSQNPSAPEPGYENPNGEPSAYVYGDAIWIYDPSAYVPTDRRGMWVVGGFDVGTSASVDLTIPNAPLLPEKLVWLQITYFLTGAPGASYSAELVPSGDESVSVVPDSEVAYAVPGESGWFYYEKMWSIQPQPTEEVITATINLPAGAVFAMDEAVVDTICIPEPATLGLLALGGVVALRRKRK